MNSTREFHPEKISRRSEAITWALALVALAALITLRSQAAPVSYWYFGFVLLVILAAASMTLGNWVDRNTVLTLKPDGIDFHNGLRNAVLKWDEIQEIQVTPSRWGDQVLVAGAEAHFHFRTLSQVTSKSDNRSKMGFTGGEFIIGQIQKNSGLKEVDQPQNSRYYTRP